MVVFSDVVAASLTSPHQTVSITAMWVDRTLHTRSRSCRPTVARPNRARAWRIAKLKERENVQYLYEKDKLGELPGNCEEEACHIDQNQVKRLMEGLGPAV